jgi:MFS family permease
MAAASSDETGGSLGEWRRGWSVVLAGGLGFAIVTMHYTAVGVLMKPLAEAYHWSRTQVASGLTIATLLWPVLGLFVGNLADRVGARRVGLVGVCGAMFALAGVGFAGPDIRSWWLAWTLVPIGAACASPIVWTLAVASRFERTRALALAVTLSISGLSGTMIPVLTLYASTHLGLRGVFWAMAAVGLVIGFASAWLWLYDARDLARTRKASGPGAKAAHVPPVGGGFTLREALAQSRFWRLGLALLLVSSSMGALSVHLQSMFTDNGLTPLQAAAVGGLMGPSVVVGRIGTGLLMDRFYGPLVAALAFTLPASACLLLLGFDGSVPLAAAIAVLAGLGTGAELDVIAYLTSRYFGMRRYGVIYGCMLGTSTISIGLMPLAGGLVFDAFGSYRPLLVALAIAMGVSVLIAATLGRYPKFDAAAAHEPGEEERLSA